MGINIIEHIVKNTKSKQKDIAKILGVTTGQVSKWKNGEYISSDRRKQLNEIANLFGENVEWSMLVKTKENADAWNEYILWHNSDFHNREIEDEGDLRIPHIFTLLSQLGASIPANTPTIDEISRSDYEWSPFDKAISSILESYSVLVQWNDVCFNSKLTDDKDFWEIASKIEATTLDVALIDVSTLKRDELLSIGIKGGLLDEFVNKTKDQVRGLIRKLLQTMNSKGIPIAVDYFLYIDQNTSWLEDEMLRSKHQSTADSFLTYADNKILSALKHNAQLLESLNRKIDILLSVKDR